MSKGSAPKLVDRHIISSFRRLQDRIHYEYAIMKASLSPPKLPPPPGWYPWPPTPSNIFGYFKPSYLIRLYFRSRDPMGADTYFQSWDKEVADREKLEEQVRQALEIIRQEEEAKLEEIQLQKEQLQQQKTMTTGIDTASKQQQPSTSKVDYNHLARNIAVKGAVSAESYLPIIRNFVKERAAVYRQSIASFIDGYRDGFAREVAQHTEFSTKGVIQGLKKMEDVLEKRAAEGHNGDGGGGNSTTTTNTNTSREEIGEKK